MGGIEQPEEAPYPNLCTCRAKDKCFGEVLETVDLSNKYFNTIVTVVQEQCGKLYVGSFVVNFVGVYTCTIQ